jgi:uncharacterized protein YdcH (DUF465 family)
VANNRTKEKLYGGEIQSNILTGRRSCGGPRMHLERSASSGNLIADQNGTSNQLLLRMNERSNSTPQRRLSHTAKEREFSLQQQNTANQYRRFVPMDLHHPILREFPEHRETIRRLKGSNDHFRSLFDEYHRLDDEIYRIEEEIDFATDQEIEELKMRRAKLKDYIYHLIRHAPAPCAPCESTGAVF